MLVGWLVGWKSHPAPQFLSRHRRHPPSLTIVDSSRRRFKKKKDKVLSPPKETPTEQYFSSEGLIALSTRARIVLMAIF